MRAGRENTYTFDEPVKLIGDTTIRAGNVTTEVKNGQTHTMRYTGVQLTEATAGGATAKYWYDPLGNLDRITTATGSQANCSPSTGSATAWIVAWNADPKPFV